MKLTEAVMAHISSIEDASTRCVSGEITKQEMKEAVDESINFLKSHISAKEGLEGLPWLK